jgi:hypothetical protein
MDSKAGSMIIHIWPCGTWCYQDEQHEMSHKSDDYEVHQVPDSFMSDEIDSLVLERTGLHSQYKFNL